MAIFKPNITDIETAKDLKGLKDYLFGLNEQLNYIFNNITPEDNFSSSALEEYKKKG